MGCAVWKKAWAIGIVILPYTKMKKTKEKFWYVKFLMLIRNSNGGVELKVDYRILELQQKFGLEINLELTVYRWNLKPLKLDAIT